MSGEIFLEHSGLRFGPYDGESVFEIEKYMELVNHGAPGGTGLQAVEFITIHVGKRGPVSISLRQSRASL